MAKGKTEKFNYTPSQVQNLAFLMESMKETTINATISMVNNHKQPTCFTDDGKISQNGAGWSEVTQNQNAYKVFKYWKEAELINQRTMHLVLNKNSGDICVLDLDDMSEQTCIDALNHFRGRTYIEKSMSGEGYHIIYKTKNLPSATRLGKMEIFNSISTSNRCVALTGDTIDSKSCPEYIEDYDPFSSKEEEPNNSGDNIIPIDFQEGIVEDDWEMDEEEQMDKARQCLAVINPSDLEYDEWLRVIQASKHAGLSLEEVESWSFDDGNNLKHELDKRETVKVKYDSSNRAEGVTVGTLMRMAGYTKEQQLQTKDEYKQEVFLAQLVKRYYYVEGTNKVWDSKFPRKDAAPRLNWEFYMNRHRYDMENEKGEVKSYPIAKFWQNGCKKVDSESWRPISQRIITTDFGQTLANTYQPVCHASNPDETDIDQSYIAPFLKLVDNMTNNKKEADLIVEWVAHLIQKPDDRPSVHLFHATDGINGIGRGTFTSIISSLIGDWHMSTLEETDLSSNSGSSRFNGYLYGSLFCSMEETNISDKYNMMERLKSICTTDGEMQQITLKNQNGIRAFVRTRLFLQSNHLDGLALKGNDRRFNVIHIKDRKHSEEEIGEVNYFYKTNKVALGHLYAYLMSVKITGAYDPYKVTSDQKIKECMKVSLKSEWQHVIDEYVGEYKCFKSGFISDYIKNENINIPSTQAIIKYLKNDLGYGNESIRVDGKKVRVWCSKDLTSEERQAHYKNAETIHTGYRNEIG